MLTITPAIALCQVPGAPSYNVEFGDAVTGDNDFLFSGDRYWDIDAGADSYQNDFYERPTVQTYQDRGGRFAAEEYFEFLDITHARVGFDDTFLYVAIDLFGLDKSTKDGTDTNVGLNERYGFRFGTHPDGRFGYLMYVDQPASRGGDLSVFNPLKTFGFVDTDGDVGGRGLFLGGATGLGVTKTDNANEESGMNGYDEDIISDGELAEVAILFSRIDPEDDTVVELALNYLALGLTANDLLGLGYFEVEAVKGGPKDPANYLWNDKYTLDEAGSPYLAESTKGLQNIYELDTLRAGAPIPEPATVGALSIGLGAFLLKRKKRS